jgi:hypothetical protein
MTKSVRLLLAACAGLLGMAFAAPALAKYEPSLRVEQTSYKTGARITADFLITAPKDDDATAKITIFSPSGYRSTLTQAPGTKVGTAVAFVRLRALADSVAPLAGPVVVGNPSDPNIQAASQRCTGSTTNQEVLVLQTTLAGSTIAIPDFVNKVGPYVTQQICLSSPYIPETAGGAVQGAQLIYADFNIKGVFGNGPKGEYQWDGVFTPYIVGTGTPNPTGTVEWRTYVGLPSLLTLKRVKSKPSRVTFTGRLSVRGLNPTGIRLSLYAGTKPRPAPNATSGARGKRVARTKGLKAIGKYTISRRKVKKRTYFQMRFEDYGLQGQPCQGASPTGSAIRCLGTDFAPLTSSQVRVLPPKKKRHK